MTEAITQREREIAKIILDVTDNKMYAETALLKISRILNPVFDEVIKERVREKIKS